MNVYQNDQIKKKNKLETIVSEETAKEKIVNISDLISNLENQLVDSNTSVEKELKKQSLLWERKISNQNQQKRSKNSLECSALYDYSSTLSKMESDYLNYKANENDNQPPNRVVVVDHVTEAEVLACHALVVSVFSNNNYNLAAELLTHMRQNIELDSIYHPLNSDIAINSDVFEELAYTSERTGSSSFETPSSPNTEQQDLYYAIHSFYYSKSIHNDAIVLTDRYDYSPDSHYLDSIQDSACAIMYAGQQKGLLTPFYTVIESVNTTNNHPNGSRYVNVYFSANYNWQYKEVSLTLSQYDYVYISFTFPTSGYRTVQTFGHRDTELYLYSGGINGTQCAYNDDEGYNRNALINYNFQANVTYILVVQLYYSDEIGNVRVAFTPSDDDDYDSITKIKRSTGFLVYEYKNILVENNPGRVSLFTLAPAVKRSFTIETTKKNEYQDTKLYYIDPRRGDSHYSDDLQFASCIVDDDGGSNNQAKISLDPRETTVPYLIVASTYSSSIIGKFNLKISGLNSSMIPFL